MTTRNYNAALSLILILILSACACPSVRPFDKLKARDLEEKIFSYNEKGLFLKEWRDIVIENPISKDENIKVTPLFKNDDASHFIIQIRDREKPHIHETHDLTVIVKSGKGILHLGKDKIPMKSGDIAFIPRGAFHYFVNTENEPAIAYVIFNPIYDGKDIIIVNEQ